MKKSMSLFTIASLLGMAVACSATAAEPAGDTKSPAQVKLVQADAKSATLRIKFVVDGKVPAPKKIDGSRDPFCAQFEILEDKLHVAADGSIVNLAMIFDEKKSKVEVPEALKKAEPIVHTLDNNKCMFSPHLIVARPGQTIKVTNSDQTGHNANFNFFNNAPVNFLVPTGQSKEVKLETDEPSAIPVDCNVHPWMKAHLIVTEHPFVGLTSEEGVLEITDIPPGEVVFRLWHESVKSFDKVSVGGKSEKLARGSRWEMELKPGVNDLGTVKLDAALFQ